MSLHISLPEQILSPREENVSINVFREHLSPIAREDYLSDSTPPLSPFENGREHLLSKGEYRYLKGSQVENEKVQYDIAIVAHRTPPEARNRSLFRRMSSSKLQSTSYSDGIKGRLIEKLVDNGLNVDIIDAGLDPVARGGRRSEYFVLLVYAPEKLVMQYARSLKKQLWLRCGAVSEIGSVAVDEVEMEDADRIQVVDHIIRESAQITEENPYVHSLFPLHDTQVNEHILKTFITSGRLEFTSGAFVEEVKRFFGEKVAIYFSFLDFYNRSLFPIALVGVIVCFLRPYLGTKLYMQVLVVWGLVVSVIWSFWFLKSWERKNNQLNFEWEGTLQVKNIMYPNPKFKGLPALNPITGKKDLFYPKWKRYPKYLVSMLFLLIQSTIMMVLIAFWITVFEILKVRYPDPSIFSVQWFSILTGGIVFGLFVDVFQWNFIVSKAGRLFTEWENWKTIEQYEKALIQKLFIMDFLSYYTWFFLLAFAYVIPGVGDRITNMLNSIIWNDTSNCCFGPYLNQSGDACQTCPTPWNGVLPNNWILLCYPCKGYVTFDRAHLDLESLFVTPIIVTQGLNLLLAVLIPWLNRKRQEKMRRYTDQKAMEVVKLKGARNIIADLEYRTETTLLSNRSAARYIENTDDQVEALNSIAREVLFQSDQDMYDPYEDYHLACVQYGFVVMFSMLWPLMPMACILINSLKLRSDAFRLCRTLRRPFPRKAANIGEWQKILNILGCTGVIVYFALIFVSTGAIEFFSTKCVYHITQKLGGNLENYRFGPHFSCISLTNRVVLLLICEHCAFAFIWLFREQVHSIPRLLEIQLMRKEYDFKSNLLQQQTKRNIVSSPIAFTNPNNSNSTDRRRSVAKLETQKFQPDRRRSSTRPTSTEEAIPKFSEHHPLISTKSLAEAYDT